MFEDCMQIWGLQVKKYTLKCYIYTYTGTPFLFGLYVILSKLDTGHLLPCVNVIALILPFSILFKFCKEMSLLAILYMRTQSRL